MDGPAHKRTASAAGTETLGAAFGAALRPGDVVVLSGPLGAGKTRFVQGVVHARHPGQRVRSPSFTLMNEYPGDPPVFHLDLYRLESREVDALGLEEAAEQGPLLVEWGERLPSSWRADALVLAFTPGEGDVRTVSATASGARGAELLAAWIALAASW